MIQHKTTVQARKTQKVNRRIFKSGLYVMLMLSIFNAGVGWLESSPPPQREEHQSLVTLLPIGGSQENHFKRLDRLDNKYLYVAGHGFGDQYHGIKWVLDQRSGKTIPLNPHDLAHLIRREMKNRNVPENRPIYLLACNAGAGAESFAQQLSKELQTTVVAPKEWLVVDQLGNSRTGPRKWTAFFNFGEFQTKTFINGIETASNESA